MTPKETRALLARVKSGDITVNDGFIALENERKRIERNWFIVFIFFIATDILLISLFV